MLWDLRPGIIKGAPGGPGSDSPTVHRHQETERPLHRPALDYHRFGSALRLLVQGQLEPALRTARQAASEQPRDWHTRYVLGHCLQDANDLAAAIDEFAEADRLSPKTPSVLFSLGIVRQLSGAYEGAISALRQALDIQPEFIAALNSLAMTQKLWVILRWPIIIASSHFRSFQKLRLRIGAIRRIASESFMAKVAIACV
jgi:tetratricopeptide (TPR) repeat protein